MRFNYFFNFKGYLVVSMKSRNAQILRSNSGKLKRRVSVVNYFLKIVKTNLSAKRKIPRRTKELQRFYLVGFMKITVDESLEITT